MKEKLLLNYYLQQDKLITIEEIASDFRISKRKAYTLIQDFNYFSKNNGCLLQSRTNLGYELQITDQQKMTAFLANAVADISYLNPNHRRLLMQIYLVSQRGYVSVSELSEYIGASKSTITADLKALAPKMASFHLEIVGKTYYGMAVVGSELNKRLCLIKALNLLPVLELHQEMQELRVAQPFRAAIRQLFSEHRVVLTEKVFLTIVQYMVIMAKRIKEQEVLTYQQTIKTAKLECLRQPLQELLNHWYHIDLPVVETDYLIDYLGDLGDQLISFQENEVRFESYTFKGLEAINQSLGLAVMMDELVCRNLSKHLLNLEARLTYGSQILFPQRKKYYQENFFEIFVTQTFLQEIAVDVDFTKMTIDEVLYVSLYFKSWFLTEWASDDYYAKETIVMVESRSLGYLLKEKLQRLYPNMAVTIFDDIDLSAIRQRVKAYDLVITSKTISREERLIYPSIIEITDYLSESEQKMLKQKIKELFEWQYLEKLLQAEDYHWLQEGTSSQAVASDWHEDCPLLLVENLFALQFVLSETRTKSRLVVEQLGQPILVEGKKVSVLLKLEFRKTELKVVKELSEALASVSRDSELHGALLRCQEIESFKDIIKKGYLKS